MIPRWNFMRVYSVLAIMLALQACGAANPIKQANTVEQKAYAAYGEFTIVEEQVAKLVSSGRLNNSQIIALGRADEAAKEVADPLIELTVEFEAIREEYEAGGTGETRFIRAMNNLNSWAERLLPLVANLRSAKKGAEQ